MFMFMRAIPIPSSWTIVVTHIFIRLFVSPWWAQPTVARLTHFRVTRATKKWFCSVLLLLSSIIDRTSQAPTASTNFRLIDAYSVRQCHQNQLQWHHQPWFVKEQPSPLSNQTISITIFVMERNPNPSSSMQLSVSLVVSPCQTSNHP